MLPERLNFAIVDEADSILIDESRKNTNTHNEHTHPITQMLPERLNFAIVDEADSILIDESRNPMILSQPLYDTAAYVAVVDRVRLCVFIYNLCL